MQPLSRCVAAVIWRASSETSSCSPAGPRVSGCGCCCWPALTQPAGTAAGWGGLVTGEELCQRWCEVFSGYSVPGAGQEPRGSVRKSVGYSPGPVAQPFVAAFAGDCEGRGADRGKPVRGQWAGDAAVVDPR